MKVVFCFLAALLAVAAAWPYYKSMPAKEAVGQHYGNICEWNPTHPLCHGTGDFKTPPLNCRRFPHHPLCSGFKSAGSEREALKSDPSYAAAHYPQPPWGRDPRSVDSESGDDDGDVCDFFPTHPLCIELPHCYPGSQFCFYKSAGFEVEVNFCERYPHLCQKSFKSSDYANWCGPWGCSPFPL